MKKSRMYTRKCLALRWALLALACLLMVNHLLGICLLLPIQTVNGLDTAPIAAVLISA